jgi:hypothetical protein
MIAITALKHTDIRHVRVASPIGLPHQCTHSFHDACIARSVGRHQQLEKWTSIINNMNFKDNIN